MTSTNDGKDVISNQTSGQKGKSYFIELYKSLEAQLNADASFTESVAHLCSAWRNVHTLCLHSAPSTHPHLISWIQRHTARTVLQSEWQKDIKDEQPKLEEAIDEFTQRCQDSAATRNGSVLPWESQLLARAAWFKSVLCNLWGHPVLKALSNLSGERPSTEEVLEWLKEERGVMFAARVRQLALSKRTEDIALTLVTAVMDLVRATREVASDLDLVDEDKEAPEPKREEPTFESILNTEAGFSEVWDLLTDIELVLLHKSDKDTRLIELAKQMPLSNGYHVVERLMGRLESAPRERKLWKNVRDVATLVTQLTIARCMVVPTCAGPVRTILYYCGRALARCCPPARLPRAAATLAAPASSARHLHTLASALHSQTTESEDAFKPFVVELYVRAITSGMNELEKLKLKPEYEEKEARATEQTLATWFIQLGNLLSSSARMQYECILTAFSVHPSPAMFDKIKSAPPLPTVAIDVQPKPESTESPSEFGSWASDSRTHTNFVKTSETLNMQQTQHQANVLSTTILNEGETLGLDAELCQDIIVLLSGPRVKTLSWDVDRKVLLSNCCSYMERCVYGTRAITTELKYLNLDPRHYQHLPEDLSDEEDINYGIEKGYEQHLAEPQPVQYWEDVYCDPERTESAESGQEDTQKKNKQPSESDSDPLSMVADKKEKKKERPHSKERSKERKKKPKDTDKSKDVKDKDKEHAEKRKDEPKDKKKEKKEKKERKKREKKEKKAKNPLIGLTVTTLHDITVTDSEYGSQGKSSLPSGGLDEKVLNDGQFSMDEIKSPEKATKDANKILECSIDAARQVAAAAIQKAQDQFARHNALANTHSASAPPASLRRAPHMPNMSRSQQSLKNEVKKNIKKLLQFRRQKMSQSATNSPVSSPNQTDKSHVAETQTNTSSLNLSKEQQDLLYAMKGEVKTYKSIFCPPKDLKISASCSRVQPFNPAAYPRKTPRPITQIDTSQSNEALNLSQLKPDTLNNNLNKLDQNQDLTTKPPCQTSPRVSGSTHLSSYERFLRELSREDDFDSSPDPKPENKKQIKPINKVTPVVPHTMNTGFDMNPIVSNVAESENKTKLNTQHMVKKTKSTKNLIPKLDNAHTATNPNLYNTTKTETGLSSPVHKAIKAETRVTASILNMSNTESKATPTMRGPSALVQQELVISPQCAKPIVQSKKVENAPNTFARLSYMHKNKLNDKSKQVMDTSAALQSSISEELDRRIAELNASKMKMDALNIQKELMQCRAGAAPQMVKSQEPPRVEVQYNEPNTIEHTLNQHHPLLANILKNASLTVKSTKAPGKNQIPKKQNSALTEKDQQELLKLLGQQNLLNRPLQQAKTNTQQSNILNMQFLNNTISKCPVVPVEPTMHRSNTSKTIHEQQATTENKGIQIRYDKSFDFPVISNVTIKKTTAMVQNMVEMPQNIQSKLKQKVARQAKIKPDPTNKTVLEVNSAVTKKYVPKPPVSLAQYREDIPEQDWTQVLDAIRSHKTPIRGPNALDMLLNKDSFEKVNERNQMITSGIPVNKADNILKQAPIASTQVNSTMPSTAFSKTSTSSTQTSENKKVVVDIPKVRNISSTKKSVPPNNTLYSDMTKKTHTSDLHKETDPFISGIPNSDYEILEELMDDDLRQEIGELLLDDEGYKAPILVASKGSKIHGNNSQIVIKRVPVKKSESTTMASVVNTPMSSTQPLKSKPQIISNEKVDFQTLSCSLIGSKIIRKEPTAFASKLKDNKIYNVNNTRKESTTITSKLEDNKVYNLNNTIKEPTTIASKLEDKVIYNVNNTRKEPNTVASKLEDNIIYNVNNTRKEPTTIVSKLEDNIIYNVNNTIPSVNVTSATTSTMFYNVAPTPPVQNMVIIDPYGMSTNINPNYMPVTNTPNFVYQPFTAPIAIISNNFIPTTGPAAAVIYNTPQITSSDLPIMHIPENRTMPTVSMQTNIPVPDLKQFELPNVNQFQTVIDASLETNNERSARNSTNTLVGSLKSESPDSNAYKATDNDSNIQKCTPESILTAEVDSSKAVERKVLSEVQEKLTKSNFDSNGPEVIDSVKNKNETLLESEQSKDQERLAKKRLAIINRNINNRSFYPAIPLTYTPLKVYKAVVNTEEKLTVSISKIKDVCFEDKNISKLEAPVSAGHNATSQVPESSICNSKENNESCRRIMLRSSNRIEPKVRSNENIQRLVGRKTKVRLKKVESTEPPKSEEANVTEIELCSDSVCFTNDDQSLKMSASKISEDEKLLNELAVEKTPRLKRASKRILYKKVKKTKKKEVKSKTVSVTNEAKGKNQIPLVDNKDVRSSKSTKRKLSKGIKVPIPAPAQDIVDVEEAIIGAMIPKPNEIDNKCVATKILIPKEIDIKTIDAIPKEVCDIIQPSPKICNTNPLDQVKVAIKVINEEKNSAKMQKDIKDFNPKNKDIYSEGKTIGNEISKTKNQKTLKKTMLKNVDETVNNPHDISLKISEIGCNKTYSKLDPVDDTSVYAKLVNNKKMSKLVDDIESAISAITESTVSSPLLETPIDNEIIHKEKEDDHKIIEKETVIPQIPSDNAPTTQPKLKTAQRDFRNKNKNSVAADPKTSPNESVKELTDKIDSKSKTPDTLSSNKKDFRIASKIATMKSVKGRSTEVHKKELEVKKSRENNSTQSHKLGEIKSVTLKTVCDKSNREMSVIQSTKTQRISEITNTIDESIKKGTSDVGHNNKLESEQINKAPVDYIKHKKPNSDEGRVKPKDLYAKKKKEKEETFAAVNRDETSTTRGKSVQKKDNVKEKQETSQLQNSTHNVPLDGRPLLNRVFKNKDKDVVLLSSENSDLNTTKITSANNLPFEQGPVSTTTTGGNIPTINDIPQSFKDCIQIVEIPIPGNTVPNKRCVRITLPNNKVFKATVHGQVNVSFDTLFEEPALKNILLGSMNDKKRYTLNIQQFSTTDHRVLETVVQEVDVHKKNDDVKTVEYVNLISDDEDEPIQKIRTASGSYKVKSIDKDILKKHQQKLLLKCEIKLRKCDDDKPTKSALVDALLHEPTSEVIEIDDSSNDGETNENQTGIDVLKNLLLKELGVSDDEQNNSTSDIPNESVLDVERPPRTRKSKYHLLRGPRTLSVEPDKQSSSQAERSKSDDTSKVPSGNKGREVTKQNNHSKNITPDCYVKLINCDYLVKNMQKDIQVCKDLIISDDKVVKCAIDDDKTPVMSRSGSFSILNEIDLLDQPLTPADGTTSPVMRVFETIHALRILSKQNRNSPVMEAYDMIVSLQNKPNFTKISTLSYKSENNVLCQSEWFGTKRDLRNQNVVDKIRNIDDIFHEIVQSKLDNSTDCDTDAATDLSTIDNEYRMVSSLKSIMLKYFEDNPLVYRIKPSTERIDHPKTTLKRNTKTTLKRKLQHLAEPAAKKVTKILFHPSITQENKTDLEVINNDGFSAKFNNGTVEIGAQEQLELQLPYDSTLQHDIVDMSKLDLIATSKDKGINIEDKISNYESTESCSTETGSRSIISASINTKLKAPNTFTYDEGTITNESELANVSAGLDNSALKYSKSLNVLHEVSELSIRLKGDICVLNEEQCNNNTSKTFEKSEKNTESAVYDHQLHCCDSIPTFSAVNNSNGLEETDIALETKNFSSDFAKSEEMPTIEAHGSLELESNELPLSQYDMITEDVSFVSKETNEKCIDEEVKPKKSVPISPSGHVDKVATLPSINNKGDVLFTDTIVKDNRVYDVSQDSIQTSNVADKTCKDSYINNTFPLDTAKDTVINSAESSYSVNTAAWQENLSRNCDEVASDNSAMISTVTKSRPNVLLQDKSGISNVSTIAENISTTASEIKTPMLLQVPGQVAVGLNAGQDVNVNAIISEDSAFCAKATINIVKNVDELPVKNIENNLLNLVKKIDLQVDFVEKVKANTQVSQNIKICDLMPAEQKSTNFKDIQNDTLDNCAILIESSKQENICSNSVLASEHSVEQHISTCATEPNFIQTESKKCFEEETWPSNRPVIGDNKPIELNVFAIHSATTDNSATTTSEEIHVIPKVTVQDSNDVPSKIENAVKNMGSKNENKLKFHLEKTNSNETEPIVIIQTDEKIATNNDSVFESNVESIPGASKIIAEEVDVSVHKCAHKNYDVQYSGDKSKPEKLDDNSKRDVFESKISETSFSENNCGGNQDHNIMEDNNNTNCKHEVIAQLDVKSDDTIKTIDMDDNYVYETEILVETQNEADDNVIKSLPKQDQSDVVTSDLKENNINYKKGIADDYLSDEEIIVEKTIKEVDCDDDVFEKNVTLVYKDDSGVVLKGIKYEDPEIGTCYVFPLAKSSDESETSEVLSSSLGSTIEVIQEIKLSTEASDTEHSTDLYVETDLKVIEPKVTYSRRNLKRKSDMRDVTCSEKRSRKSSRSRETTEIKIPGKKYRKSKNIDMPKLSASAIAVSGNIKDFKRRLDYYSTVEFSYAVTFSTESIDPSELLKKWPIDGPIRSEVYNENEHQHALFFDLDREENSIRDPLQLSLMEEIAAENEERSYPNWNAQETNFNMGFGEGSGRVKQNLDGGTISKFSAATLSDVKQNQPCLLSKAYFASREDLSLLKTSKQEELETIKRYFNYVHLREKVRSFFRKSSIELIRELNKEDVKGKNKNCDTSLFPFEFFYSKCIEPFPVETIVQVVQVGQLPVSAGAQNPVTCDPRVTQVSDASPSQCSVVNSPHDDSQPEIKTEYTELTNADLSLPLVDDYVHHNQTLPGDSQNSTNMSNTENIPIQTELVKSEVKIEIVEETPEEKENCEVSEVNNHVNNVEYLYDGNNINPSVESDFQALFSSGKQDSSETLVQQKSRNGSSEKTDQIAHAMNAAGITTTSETANTRAQALVNILTQKLRQGAIVTTPNSMSLQQALASILPPPLNQTSSSDTNQQGQNTVTPQVLHIVQGKNSSGNQITLVDNTQQSVITTPNATPVLHIVQNKATSGQNSNGAPASQANTFSGLSLVDAGLQQGGNQLLHIVNTGNQKNNNAGQLLKRVNLLTNLTNVQGSNEQKMVQFVCKSADGKAIQLNAPHQRSMVLRLQPIETSNVQPSTPKPAETTQDSSPSQSLNSATNKDSSPTQQEIKSRSVYEENYAKFIQNSSNKPTLLEKSNSLPKFNQAFGKAVFQDGNQKQNEMNSNSVPSGNTNTDSPEGSATDNTINIDHIGQISSPPLLLRKSPAQTTQAQQNLVQQIKQTIAPMNIQTMHGGVIYTRQIPVNIGGGQTINLITVPSTELIDESGQKQQVNQGETIEPSIIKIVPQSQPPSNAEVSDDMNNDNAQQSTPQPQPVLTQMRIKLPMLSKTPQMVSGARVVRPSFFQIQRNVISGGNQAVYQQLVLTAAPPLGQQTIRLPQAQTRQIKVPDSQASSESQMSSSTLEQLREFDMVLEQVKERSTVQPNSNPSSSFKLHTPSTDTTDSPVTATSTSAETTQVLYSIGSGQPLNVTYINRKSSVSTPTTSTFVRSPDSSGIADSPTSSSHSHIPHTSASEASSGETTHHKPVKVSSKSKSRPKSSSHPPNSMKLSSVPPKTSTQKPLEDEQTTQRILYILAEYKEQVENSPDKDKPAPRRRSNPPSNPSGSSKRKKSSSSSRRSGRDISPVHGDDTCRTMGSEDSSCGTSQGDCAESCMDSHSPQDSPRKVARKLAFEQDLPVAAQPRPQPQRNVIVADGQTITVARGTAGKPATAVLMPANYILPVSMVKGGQQIAIVTNRGPKLLTVGGGEGGATNALLLQRLIGPAGLKPVLTRPGVRHVRLPTAALHNLQAFNLATSTPVQPPDSTASPAPDPPSDLTDSNRADHSPWTDRESEIKPDRTSSPDDSEPWNMPSSADPHDYSYEETVRADNMDRTVLVVHKKDSSHRQTRLSHVSAAALRHKYAILEHELRLQKSLSEECEDLGVDSPSASELFPEAELLFAASPAQEHGPDTPQHSHTPQPTLLNQSVIQPDIDDQIATDQLLPRHNIPSDRQDLDVNLGLEDVGIVTVSEDGMQATIALDQEEFARAHPNTTFHSEPTDEGEVQPFTISGLKSRHITSTIFHSNRAPATVLMTTPQATVISQASTETSQNPVKYSDIDNMIHSIPSTHNNNINLSSVLVKDDGLTRFDNILTDSRELHLSNTASAIVHSAGNATQVIRRVCYDDSKRERESFLMDEPDALIAGDDAKMIAEDSSRDATLESMGGDVDDDNSLPERHAELFWESNSASERSESRRPLDFSSDSEKCCKSPSYDETNSTDSSGVGTHMRLDSVIKEARGIDRSASADGSSADDTHPPLRTYPPKRLYHNPEGELERSLSGKTRAGERSPDMEVRRRASGRGVVKRGCHCCNGSPAPPRPKKPRQRKPTMDFTN